MRPGSWDPARPRGGPSRAQRRGLYLRAPLPPAVSDRAPSLFAAIAAEVRALDVSRPALRSFGRAVGGVLLAIAGVVWWRRGWDPSAWVWGLGGVGAALVVLGLAAPAVLRPVYRAWMTLAFALGWVMTRVLLTLVFALVVTPIALLARLVGRDRLGLKPPAGAASYWVVRDDPAPSSRERLERYF